MNGKKQKKLLRYPINACIVMFAILLSLFIPLTIAGSYFYALISVLCFMPLVVWGIMKDLDS